MAMNSWWQLGEMSGYRGSNLSLCRIECALCGEKGNFAREFHAEKKNPDTKKTLNFDVYKCGNCAGYVHVLWSGTAGAFSDEAGQHGYMVLPWPINPKPEPSKNLSPEMGRFWTQAHQTLRAEAWDASSTMARSALQLALRDHNASGRTLKDQIDDLASRGLLPPAMKDWSHEVRLLGNVSAHPNPGQPPTDPDDVRQAVDFMDFLLYCLYDLPAEVAEYRQRRQKSMA